MERDESQEVCKAFRANFNSHAHVERDTFVPHCPPRPTYFNSHAHVERDRGADTGRTAFVYFNSHAHVERDISHEAPQSSTRISTHTLTWSVTSGQSDIIVAFSEFQLTRSRGA